VRDTSGMEIFVRVVERGSFSGAALDLNLTPSAVSKQVSRIEADLGVRLLNRSTHELFLTDAGKIYHERCLRILRDINLAREAVHEANATLTGTLKLHLTPGTGQQLVLPALRQFLKEHQGLTVDLMVEPEALDILQNGVDLSIRSGTADDANLRYTSVECRPMFEARYLICAAPEYFRNHGKPKDPRELTRHNCLLYVGQPSFDKWMFTDGGKQYGVNVGGRFRANDWSSVRDAALDGLGIARLLAFDAASGTSGGRLQSIFDDEVVCGRTVWAFYPRTRSLPRKTTVFLDYLDKALRAR
jgi:DNA-binding transcriptional LysR family regulator